MTDCLHLRGLTKTFPGPVHAVAGIDLHIRSGEVVALLGPNGAGKTTTLDLVLGFTAPDEGVVEVFGTSPAAAIAAGRVGAVLQTGGLLRDLTVRETVELIASLHLRRRPVDAVLDRAGLSRLADRRVQGCSGGEQQRLRFALALLSDPDLLILDEPTTGMDVEARRTFWEAMHAEADDGRTVVFATHYLQEAEDVADRTVVMANGRIVADGATDEIRRRAAARRVAATVTADTADRLIADVRAIAPTASVQRHGDRLVVEAADADAVALRLLTAGATDLEVSRASLEQAFVRLTTAAAAEPASATPSPTRAPLEV